MRIWHEKLIPKLCRQHLLACWREGLGCYSIIINNKKGYRNHPQVKEFEGNLPELHQRLLVIRKEMLERGYKPKELPWQILLTQSTKPYKPWQSLEKQTEILREKCDECKKNLEKGGE